MNEYASGDFRGRSRISHRGRSPLRAAACQQAWQLIKSNQDFAERFFHLQNRSVHPRLLRQQACVAVANSYLRTAHVLVTQRILYLPRAERRLQEAMN